jgi:hypothetical protein
MKTLVLTRSTSRVFPDDVRVGWRITCRNGELYDWFWGSAKPSAIDSLIADVRQKYREVVVLDLRQQQPIAGERLELSTSPL